MSLTTKHRRPEEHEFLGLVVDNTGRRAGSGDFVLAIYHRSGGKELTRLNLCNDTGFPAPKIGTRYKIDITIEEVPNAD